MSTNLVRFYKKWKQNNFKTEKAGHPVGEHFDYISIQGLGQDKAITDRQVQTKDQLEYGREWDLYQRGQEQTAEGIPLSEWPVLGGEDQARAEITRLNSHAVHTVEAMAACSDAGLIQIGHGAMDLRKKAQIYLEESAPKAAAANLTVMNDKLTAENLALQTRVSALEAIMSEAPKADTAVPDTRIGQMEAQIAVLVAAQGDISAKRGPGRPKTKVA